MGYISIFDICHTL